MSLLNALSKDGDDQARSMVRRAHHGTEVAEVGRFKKAKLLTFEINKSAFGNWKSPHCALPQLSNYPVIKLPNNLSSTSPIGAVPTCLRLAPSAGRSGKGEVSRTRFQPIDKRQLLNHAPPNYPITQLSNHQITFALHRPLARYPSGKGEVCKTFMRRFESGPRLKSSN